MNITSHNNSLKAVMWLAMFVLCGFAGKAASSEAQSKLSIDPVSFSNKEKTMVQVNFKKVEPIVGMQFQVVLPSFLEFDGNTPQPNQERLGKQNVVFNPKTGILLIMSPTQAEIQGEDGALLYLPVKVKSSVSQPASGNIQVKNITYSGAASQGDAQSWKQNPFSVAASYSPYTVAVTPTFDKVNVMPGVPATIGFNFEADCEVVGFQLDIVMPEGLNLDVNSIAKTDRCPGSSTIQCKKNDGFYRVVYADFMHGNLLGTSGEVFTIQFNAESTYSVAAAEIKVQNIQISNQNDDIVIANPFNIQVVNEAPLYQTLKASVADLRTKLQAALATIAQDCPDVADQFDGTEISAKIDQIAQDIENHYTAGDLTSAADAINAAIAAVVTEINAYVDAAKAAEAQFKEDQRQAANQAAYDATLAKIAALQTELNNAKAKCEQDYPGVDITANVQAAQAAIDAAKAGALAAFNAVAEAGTYEYNLDEAGIKAKIAKVLSDAKTEFDRKAANQAAYDSTLAKIAALQTELNNAKAKCEQDYPGIDITANVQAAQAAIDAAKAGALAAFNAVAEAGTYEYNLDEAGIKTLIAKVLSDAKTAYDIAQEEARQAANQAAYDAALAQINALQASLNDAIAQVNEQYDDVDVTSEITAAQNAIDQAKADALAAFNAVAEAGNFDYEVPVTEIQGLIDAILQAAANASENNRKTYNQNAYNNAIASLDELQAKLNEAIQYAEQNCPHANVVAEVNQAQTAITNARSDAKLAFLACENSGLFDYTVPVEEIEALIQNVKTAADAKEAEWLENQRREANLAAYNESLDEIADLQAALNDMKAKVESEFPNYDATADVNAAQQAIDDAKAAADAEYASVENAGQYDYDVPVQTIRALIQTIYDNAKSSGVLGIEMDNLEEGTKVFDLNGHMVTRPLPGTVVIVVKANGQRYKCVAR